MSEMLGVYKAINAVQAELAEMGGISKSRKNVQQGYAFRGIDEVYNTLAPILAKHKLLILPKVLERQCEEIKSVKGTPLFYVTLKTDFYFTSAEDGSQFIATSYGEAMDSADKATNKAMSAAYKYVCLQAFSIPTEGDNDADATTHIVAPRETKPAARMPQYKADPNIIQKINACKTVPELAAIFNGLKAEHGDAFPEVQVMYQVAFTKRKNEILQAAKNANH